MRLHNKIWIGSFSLKGRKFVSGPEQWLESNKALYSYKFQKVLKNAVLKISDILMQSLKNHN